MPPDAPNERTSLSRQTTLALLGAGVALFAVLILALGGGATDPDGSASDTSVVDDDDGPDRSIVISGPGDDEPRVVDDVEAVEIDCDDPDADDTTDAYRALCGAAVDDEGEIDGDFRYSDLPTITLDRLPIEALETLELIEDGGPYPYRQDDGVFQNREGILPDQPRGYYREYTVETPGSDDRGARRIVAGVPGEYYWTDDHYDSFSEIVF